MANFNGKTQVFILGLLVGLIAAGSFFVFKLDDYVAKFSMFQRHSDAAELEAAKLESTQAGSTLKEEKEAIVPKKKTNKPGNSIGKKTDLADSAVFSRVADSVHFVPADDGIVVRKDVLLGTATLEVNNLTAIPVRSAKDSLAAKVAGVKEENQFSQFMNIEFWNSPLNYKGYKMGKYKIVLYGFTSGDNPVLYRLADKFFLKTKSAVFQLENTADFKPFDQVTDQEILAKLKS